ncbi:MAG: nucleotidyltransferase domain-containing protein [Spirochaetales bacterium]|nr:nucleotidyltransferase domain-containing protein [Spirochaetales bacterium]
MISSKEIASISKTIIDTYKPEKVILFGSYARETANESSDLDLLIISDREKNLPRYKRGLKLRVKLAEYRFKKDLLFYTFDEISKWEQVQNSFIYNVIKEGIVLYG